MAKDDVHRFAQRVCLRDDGQDDSYVAKRSERSVGSHGLLLTLACLSPLHVAMYRTSSMILDLPAVAIEQRKKLAGYLGLAPRPGDAITLLQIASS